MSPGPGVAGLGIDLIEIDRVERALERRPRLAGRLFRPGELAACAGRARPARHLAARFAAKEAAIKALGGGFPPRDVEVVGSPAPRLRLHGRAAAVAAERGVELAVSLTHSRDNAAAVVLAGSAAPTA
ncbi:MAG: holo-ACP synthase [Thermoleophilia bacterium]|nr:holo-ACP synthase [Thermoleophilia bacterium]GIK77510.1 MAG: holo-[acyl-carrier-protein] synthase [Actinomycetes bacterium]